MSTIERDVDRGLEIRAEVARLALELKEIEGRLEKAGLAGDQVKLQDEDREGMQWPARGSTLEVPVIFAADSIVGSFAPDTAMHMQLRDILGPQLKEFYRQKFANVHKDGKAFRAKARELLGEKAPGMITACLARDKNGIPKSKVVVAWTEARTYRNEVTA